MKKISHKEKVEHIATQLKDYVKTGDQRKIRFTHGSTNSTRVQDKTDFYLIDISSCNEILNIDANKKIATVEPNVSMDTLVKECLQHGLLPKVVMEFPGITCGGGVNGAALESSSYKYGQFNDACTEYECILGDGTIIYANKNNHADLFYGISGSYGTLALLTAITISLLPAKPYVSLRCIRVGTDKVISELKKLIDEKQYDYLDAIIFSKEDALIITGMLSEKIDHPLITFTKPTDEWFYLYVQGVLQNKNPHEISVPIKDFLFRYDRGAFWMGEHAFNIFHVPFHKTMRTVLNLFMNTKTMYTALHKTNAAQDFFIQDFYVPFSETKRFLEFTKINTGIYPLWLCPIKSTKTPQYLSPHYLQENMLIDVGVWGSIPKNKDIGEINRMFEKFVHQIGGRKMLYAQAFYTEESFWKIYDQKAYLRLRKKYKATMIFPTVWEKIHVKKRYAVNKYTGVIETIGEVMTNRLKRN